MNDIKQQDGRRRTGAVGEKAAARFLSDRGFLILARNFSCPHGELDLVARKRGLIVFAEVKTRSTDEYGAAEESVTRRKREKIHRTAAVFARRAKLNENELLFRFDVFAVYVNARGRVVRLEHFPDAFGTIG